MPVVICGEVLTYSKDLKEKFKKATVFPFVMELIKVNGGVRNEVFITGG